MPSIPPPRPNDLSVEDFRRLGVRPNEVRLSVIREAAFRNARPLASELLTIPSNSSSSHPSSSDLSSSDPSSGGQSSSDDSCTIQSWLQLSRVATSTYRLLNPRLRSNHHQRAYVGRILPLALNAAGTTRFHAGHQPAGGKYRDQQDSVEIANSDFSVVPPPMASAFGAQISQAPNSVQLPDAEVWQLSLDDRDLVSSNRSISGKFKRRRSPQKRGTHNLGKFVVASLIAFGACVGAILGWNSLSKRVDIVKSPKPSAVEPAVVASSEVQTDKIEETVAVVETTLPKQLPETSTVESIPEVDKLVHGMPDLPSIAATSDDTSTDVDRAAIVTLDKTAYLENQSEFETPSTIASVPTTPTTPVAQTLFPVPNADDVALAQRRIFSSAVGHNARINRFNIQSASDSITEVLSHLSPGSVDHYAAAAILSSFVWLKSGENQPELTALTAPFSAYQIDEPSIWTQSYIDASAHVTLPKKLSQFFVAGFSLIESLISKGSLEKAGEVFAVIQQQSDQYQAEITDADSLKTLVASYQKSMKYAKRISTTAQRVLELRGDVGTIPADVSGASSLGRYYCLVLGDWNQGLRFLAETSDPRLAALANSELEMLTVDPFLADPLPWTDVANRWNLAADRLSGRSADQVRLHAIELLRLSSLRTDGMAKLDAKRQIEDLKERLPSHFRLEPASIDTKIVQTATSTKRRDVSDKEASKEPAETGDWLSGRLTADGKDLGIRLRYQLGVPISQTMLGTIEKQIRRPLENAEIELEGNFVCEDDQFVILSLNRSTSTDLARPNRLTPKRFTWTANQSR